MLPFTFSRHPYNASLGPHFGGAIYYVNNSSPQLEPNGKQVVSMSVQFYRTYLTEGSDLIGSILYRFTVINLAEWFS